MKDLNYALFRRKPAVHIKNSSSANFNARENSTLDSQMCKQEQSGPVSIRLLNDDELLIERMINELFLKIESLIAGSDARTDKLSQQFSLLKKEFIMKLKRKLHINSNLATTATLNNNNNYIHESDRLFNNFKENLSSSVLKRLYFDRSRGEANSLSSSKIEKDIRPISNSKKIALHNVKSLSKDFTVLKMYPVKSPDNPDILSTQTDKKVSATCTNNFNGQSSTKGFNHRTTSNITQESSHKKCSNSQPTIVKLNAQISQVKKSFDKYQQVLKTKSSSKFPNNTNVKNNYEVKVKSTSNIDVPKLKEEFTPTTINIRDNFVESPGDRFQLIIQKFDSQDMMNKIKSKLGCKYGYYLDFSYNDFCSNSKNCSSNSHLD